MAVWDDLPAELRLKIFGFVAGADEKLTHDDFHEPNKADYVVVNREWQDYFERRTFAYLTVFNHQMEYFHQIIKNRPERLKHVRSLQYTIDLPHYYGDQRFLDEDEKTIEINNIVFSHSMMLLVRTLSLWQPPSSEIDNTRRHAHMQLELGVRSYSDAMGHFKDMRILDPHGPVLTNKGHCDMCSWLIGKRASGWYGHERVTQPPQSVVRRTFGGALLTLNAGDRNDILTLTDPTSEARDEFESLKLLAAPVVRKIAASRNFYRCINPEVYGHLIQHFFPRVESLKLEPWRPVRTDSYDALEDGFVKMLDTLPPKMHTLSVYIEHHRITHPDIYPGRSLPYAHSNWAHIHQVLDHHNTRVALSLRMPRVHVAERLAKYMHTSEIEHVCAVGFVEATDLFTEILQLGTCRTVKTLLVSSGAIFFLREGCNESDHRDLLDYNDSFALLLAVAARSIEHMPYLEELEVVSTSLTEPWRFKFSVTQEKGQTVGGHTESAFRLSYKTPVSPTFKACIRKAWAAAAKFRHSRILRISFPRQDWDSTTRLMLLESSLSHSFLLPRSIQNIEVDRWAMTKAPQDPASTAAHDHTPQCTPGWAKNPKSCRHIRISKKRFYDSGIQHQHRSDKARWHNCSGCGKDKCVAAMGGPCRFGKDNSVKQLIYELNDAQIADDRVHSAERRRMWESAFVGSFAMSRQLGHWDTYDNSEAYNTNLPYASFYRKWCKDPYSL